MAVKKGPPKKTAAKKPAAKKAVARSILPASKAATPVFNPGDTIIALMLEGAGVNAQSRILQVLRDAEIAQACYAYKIRVKPKNKLLEKKDRKRLKKPDYELEKITDVVGLRLVTLFKGDMVEVLERLLVVMCPGKSDISPNPFRQVCPEEVIVYQGTTVKSQLYGDLEAIAKKYFKTVPIRLENSQEGYSSIHVVCRLAETLQIEGIPHDYYLPVEIQIRTVFEDAWGEVDHKFGYVIREGKEAGQPINNPESVMAHLRVFKTFADGCVDYAEAIKKEATVKTIAPDAARPISMESDDEMLSKLQALGLSQEFIKNCREAKTMREEAFKDTRTEGDERITEAYVEAAERFREIGNKLEPTGKFLDGTVGERLALYYCRMNQAVCLMSTNKKEQVSAALQLYLTIEPEFKNDPLLQMRTGQAHGKQGNFDLALKKLEEADTQLQALITSGKAGEPNLPEQMPYGDFVHLRRSIPKLRGFYLWRQIESMGKAPSTTKAKMYKQAYDLTSRSLEPDAPVIFKREVLNNLVYYAVGYLQHTKTKPAKETKATIAFRQVLVEKLKALAESAGAIKDWDIEEHDTIVKAYIFLGKVKEARGLAGPLRDKCLSSGPAAMNTATRMAIAQYANELANKGTVKEVE